MGHESRIEPWLPMTTVLLVSFRTDWLRREDTMKTAWKETGNRWAAVFSIRMDGAAGQNRTCSSTWGWKQEKFQRWGKCFLLTSPSIEHPPRRNRQGFLRPLGLFCRDGFGGFLPQSQQQQTFGYISNVSTTGASVTFLDGLTGRGLISSA